MEQGYKIGTMLGADPFVLLYNDMYYLYCTTEIANPDLAAAREAQNRGIHVYTHLYRIGCICKGRGAEHGCPADIRSKALR